MNYQAALQKKSNLTTEAKGLFEKAAKENRSLNEAEKQRDDAIAAELTALNDDITRMERQRERERNLPAVGSGDPDNAAGDDERSSVRTRPNNQTGGPFGTFGEQLKAIHQVATNGRDSAAARDLLINGVSKYNALPQGVNESIDNEGGYLVQRDFSREIFRRMNDVGQIFPRVRKISISPEANSYEMPTIDESSRANGSRWGGIQGYWVDEAGTPTTTKPKFGKLELKLKKVAALGYVTDEQLRDVAATAALLQEGFAEELTFKIEDAIINGDGSGKPVGIVNTANPSLISQAKETGQTAATVVHNNIKKMWTRFHARSRPNGVWFINQEVEAALDDLAKVIGTAGVEPNYVTYTPEGVLRIKGRPVISIEYCAALGTVNDIILVDLSQYLLIDKGGVEQANSMHVAFTTHEQAFRATYRVDGQPMWKSALTPFKATSGQTLGPAITLATRA